MLTCYNLTQMVIKAVLCRLYCTPIPFCRVMSEDTPSGDQASTLITPTVCEEAHLVLLK